MVELREASFNDEILVPSEPHLAFVLLLGTYSSMNMDGKINFLNEAVNHFLNKMLIDEIVSKRIDIAIVGFNDTAIVVQDFTPLTQMKPVTLSVNGCTVMNAGINLALDKLKERIRLYNEYGIPCFKP